MIRHFAHSCIFTAVLLIPQVYAQCPAGTTNPNSVLAGVWTFESDGFSLGRGLNQLLLANGGRFVATSNGNLTITQTGAVFASSVRLETDIGRFVVNSDCSGGTLTFNLSSRPVQFDFFFAGPNRINFISTTSGDIVSGSATRVSGGVDAPSCPANPLTALPGTWTFEFDGFHFPQLNQFFLAAVGRFVTSIDMSPSGTNRSSEPIGVLSITQTSSINGKITRLETDAGRYALNADCSGGTLTFNTSSRPIQLDFFFTSPTSIQFVGSNNGDIIEGSATRVQ
jgi:hypothetical protein